MSCPIASSRPSGGQEELHAADTEDHIGRTNLHDAQAVNRFPFVQIGPVNTHQAPGRVLGKKVELKIDLRQPGPIGRGQIPLRRNRFWNGHFRGLRRR